MGRTDYDCCVHKQGKSYRQAGVKGEFMHGNNRRVNSKSLLSMDMLENETGLVTLSNEMANHSKVVNKS